MAHVGELGIQGKDLEKVGWFVDGCAGLERMVAVPAGSNKEVNDLETE